MANVKTVKFLAPLFLIILITIIVLTNISYRKVTQEVVSQGKSNSTILVSNISANSSLPVYVVGSQQLLKSINNAFSSVGLSPPVMSISIQQLQQTPNDSIIIVDWNYVNSSIVKSDPSNIIILNLSSFTVNELSMLIRRGDLVTIFANATYSKVAEFLLGYAWAKASNEVAMIDFPDSNPYFFSIPLVPLNSQEAVLFVAKWVRPGGFIIGPVYLSQFPEFYINLLLGLGQQGNAGISGNDPLDPCYAAYENFTSGNSPTATATKENYTFFWAAPEFGSTFPQYGIPGYSDGNGTFYWDTCIEVPHGIYTSLSVSSMVINNVIGYESYLESPTMYNNNGREERQTSAIDYYYGYQMYEKGNNNAFIIEPGGNLYGTSWFPAPTSEISGYSISIALGSSLPTVNVGITVPIGSEYIGGSANPMKTINVGGTMVYIDNITWVFNFEGSSVSGKAFSNEFLDNTPPTIILPNFSPTSYSIKNYSVTFNVDFSNYALTCYIPRARTTPLFTYESIWTNVNWYLVIVPQSSSLANFTGVTGLFLSSQWPNSYVSGVSSGSNYPDWNYSSCTG
ncbi:hypothetical protein [Caldisphaera sp.]|uniref:hypothetical protein n=1 Tax=Caldisphaera sp. TaxID=2060322 RepID=UPI0025BA4990|nr:hypothetical protein [Caldisphaera sp.]